MSARPTIIGKAPGRLDVLGGVADYSGSLVLETPLSAETTVELRETGGQELRFHFEGLAEAYALLLDAFNQALAAGVEAVRAHLQQVGAPEPVYYVAGCLAVFLERTSGAVEAGLEFSVSSQVPQGMGVSSSAALEIATLRALNEFYGADLGQPELARLGQRAENLVVGAPCGIMDQLTSACGERGALLPILCRPDQLQEPVRVPEGVLVAGWHSGVKHSVAGSAYGIARTAAFMGKRIFSHMAGREWDHAAEIDYPHFCAWETRLPERLRGAEFLREFGQVDDPLSRIHPEVEYPVRAALRFPILENLNAQLALTMLRSLTADSAEGRLQMVGELLYESHAGYSAMGLGTAETDAMVATIREHGAKHGFYGARISGGGCGGTVVILLHERALPRLRELAGAENLAF